MGKQLVRAVVGAGWHPCRELCLRFPGTPLAVRMALATLFDDLSPLGLEHEDRGTLEIVLAEVLNNVVEHAYGEAGRGAIEVRLVVDGAGLDCTVFDDGRPMPGGRLPAPARLGPPDAEGALPDGGFGWGLIHALCPDLDYAREGQRNRLRFRLALWRGVS